MLIKKLELKRQCWDQIYAILMMPILLWKEILSLIKKKFPVNDFEAPNNTVNNATVANTLNDNVFGEKKLVFKNNAPFMNCISKVNGVQIDKGRRFRCGNVQFARRQ